MFRDMASAAWPSLVLQLREAGLRATAEKCERCCQSSGVSHIAFRRTFSITRCENARPVLAVLNFSKYSSGSCCIMQQLMWHFETRLCGILRRPVTRGTLCLSRSQTGTRNSSYVSSVTQPNPVSPQSRCRATRSIGALEGLEVCASARVTYWYGVPPSGVDDWPDIEARLRETPGAGSQDAVTVFPQRCLYDRPHLLASTSFEGVARVSKRAG